MIKPESSVIAMPTAAESAPRAPEYTDTRRAARIGLWALGIGFGGFLLWAAVAPLDEGVPAQGMVTIDTKRKPVQHLSGGIIREVLVHEGQLVTEGQVLLRLNGDNSRANYEAVRQNYLGLRAMQGRLLAEQRGAPQIEFHPDLLAARGDFLIQQQMATQEQLFQSRKSSLQAELQGIEENIQGQQGLLQAYQTMLPNRQTQLALLTEELNNTRELVKEGYVARSRQWELERMAAEANASVAELLGNITRAQRAISEARQRLQQRRQDYRKEVESQLADVGREVESDAQKLIAAKGDLDRIEIRAPATGQVLGLAIQSVGSVVQPGQKLMDIVPHNEALLLEAHIPPHLIDRVRTEQPADVRFAAFAHSPQLVVEGKLESISGDLLSDPQNPQNSYFLARVAVTPKGMKALGDRQLLPGMPAEIIIKTGERSMLTYLLHPLTKRLAASLKEE